MATPAPDYRQQLLEEIGELPAEYLPNLLQLIRVFRETVTLRPAADTLRQGLREALAGETRPICELWEGIDAE
ncbi:MAG: hypothetical protein AB1505_33615 [Candidatus Latescibacterota bacterium]